MVVSGLARSEEHTSELQSHHDLVCRLLLEKKKLHDELIRHIALQLLIRQTDAILHAHLITHAALLAQNRDALHFDSVLDDRCVVAVERGGRAVDSGPRAVFFFTAAATAEINTLSLHDALPI